VHRYAQEMARIGHLVEITIVREAAMISSAMGGEGRPCFTGLT
jgi:hypothetical protein